MVRVEDLIQLERQGWRALSRDQETARAFYRPLLVSDAVMVFPGGLLLEGRDAILAAIDQQPWTSFEIHECRVISLSDETAAVVCRVVAQREDEALYEVLVSSVYVARHDRWRLALHHQTSV